MFSPFLLCFFYFIFSSFFFFFFCVYVSSNNFLLNDIRGSNIFTTISQYQGRTHIYAKGKKTVQRYRVLMYLNKLSFNNYRNLILFQKPTIVVLPSAKFVISTNLKTQYYDAANRFYATSMDPNTSSQVNEREKLEKFIKKSKILTKLNGNPKFNGYFEKIKEAGTLPTITSFFILHELTAVIPLFMFWYMLYHLDFWDEFNITESSNPLLIKCNKAIERLVGDKYESLDKHKLIITGAISYSIVKVMGPLRMLVSLWAAPYFGRYLMVPFRESRLFLKRIWSKYQ